MNDSILTEADRLENKVKDIEGAIALMHELLRTDPKCIDAYIHLAADSGILGRYALAEHYARCALSLDSKSWQAWYYLAKALMSQGWFAVASAPMDNALSLAQYLPSPLRSTDLDSDAIALKLSLTFRKQGKKREDMDTPVFVKIPGAMKTYRNIRHGFEINIPEELVPVPTELLVKAVRQSDPSAQMDMVNAFQFGGPNEAFNFVMEHLFPAPPLVGTVNEYTLYAEVKGYTDTQFGRIIVAGREHVWARYHVKDEMGERWNKKYMLVFGYTEYSITVTTSDRSWFEKRQKDWDGIVSSFRLLAPINDEPIATIADVSESHQARIYELKQRVMRKQAGGLLYVKAYEAAEAEDYAAARFLLEKCLADQPDHILAHKELAVVLTKLGYMRKALYHRKQVKRLSPSDTTNQFRLVELLAGLGARNEALREVEWLITLQPSDQESQALKASLVNRQRPNYQLIFLFSILAFAFVIAVSTGLIAIKSAVWWIIPLLLSARGIYACGPWVGIPKAHSAILAIVLAIFTVAGLLISTH